MTAIQTENERRADRAYRALLMVGEDGNEVEENAVDLITDILHMLDLQYGLEPADAQRMAWHHFIAERDE
jgi:hypothetical protein